MVDVTRHYLIMSELGLKLLRIEHELITCPLIRWRMAWHAHFSLLINVMLCYVMLYHIIPKM